VPDARLLAVQEVAHRACIGAASTKDLWRHYAPGGWTPHVTLGYGLTPANLATAAEVILPRLTLALTGWTAEVEDGATGQAWPLN
jgi:hypothetical protein